MNYSRGYTLIEMIIVIVIIGILAGIAVQSLNKSDESRRFDETMAEMDNIARAIAGDERLITNGSRTDFGYVGDVGSLPSSLDNLTTNPGSYSTWRGPYISNSFDENVEDFKRDAWNNTYIYTGGTSISSPADRDPITKQFAGSVGELTSNTIKGIIRDKSGFPPGDNASNIEIAIFFPDGSGSMTVSTTSPSRSGEFSFDNQVPIGIHLIRAIDTNVNDTASKYIAINPGSTTLAELRMPSDLWGSAGGSGASGYLEYVSGSAEVFGPGSRNMRFDIKNGRAGAVTIVSAKLIYDIVPGAYYQKVTWDRQLVYDNQRLSSGDDALFSGQETVDPEQVLTVTFENFRDEPVSGGSFVNVTGINFEVIFSNGDTISFSTP